MPHTLFAIALGAALGGIARYGVIAWMGKILPGPLPWGTVAVNLVGCFVMGVLSQLCDPKWDFPFPIRPFLLTGALGAFTTFSTFALDIAILMDQGHGLSSALYLLISVCGSIGALLLGLYVAHFLG